MYFFTRWYRHLTFFCIYLYIVEIGGNVMAKARRAKSTRRTSTSRTNSRSTTRTRKKKNNIDKNL